MNLSADDKTKKKKKLLKEPKKSLRLQAEELISDCLIFFAFLLTKMFLFCVRCSNTSILLAHQKIPTVLPMRWLSRKLSIISHSPPWSNHVRRYATWLRRMRVFLCYHALMGRHSNYINNPLHVCTSSYFVLRGCDQPPILFNPVNELESIHDKKLGRYAKCNFYHSCIHFRPHLQTV